RSVFRMDVEDPLPGDDQPDLVLVVPVLAGKFGEHRFEPGSRGGHVDDVGRDVAAARLQLRELALVRVEDARGRCRRDLGRGVDALVVDPDSGQLAGNPGGIGELTPLGGYSDSCHSQSLNFPAANVSARGPRRGTRGSPHAAPPRAGRGPTYRGRGGG